jgi:hypothetical protein
MIGQLKNAAEGRPAADKSFFDIDFSQITRLKGDLANGDNTDLVVYGAYAELAMRRLIARFGFDRLPLSWSELNGVLEYCQDLSLAAGGLHDTLIGEWQAAARKVKLKYCSWQVPAFDAYVAGDVDKLRRTAPRFDFPAGSGFAIVVDQECAPVPHPHRPCLANWRR